MNKNPSSRLQQTQILVNEKIHNRISGSYEGRHGEIFNNIEQTRLRDVLVRSLSAIHQDIPLRSLDIGCGSGNLTRHLLELGASVTSADVSQGFLDLVRNQFGDLLVDTIKLNGSDLSGIPDKAYDFVATYSVLHHVPDYLGLVSEMARVCRPGGVIFIDHEPSPYYWSASEQFRSYQSQVATFDFRKFLVLNNYVGKLRRIFNPRFTNEGDIHVWHDDHVEWSSIKDLVCSLGFDVLLSDDYLLFRKGYRQDVYDRYKVILADMRVMAFSRR